MTRHCLTFPCAGETLTATLDNAAADTGLFIVSGGNETRSGAHGGMAQLAASIASAGHPVFRYDRRGIGDSSGDNGGFETGGTDIGAALAAFRDAAPQLRRIIAFGNCDAATSLALLDDFSGLSGLVLANPWVIEGQSDLPPPAAIRARYKAKLLDPKEWVRLMRGGVDIGKLFKGLRRISAKPEESGLTDRLRTGLSAYPRNIEIILARRDATALAFMGEWDRPAFDSLRSHVTVTMIESASHSFANPDDRDQLRTRLLSALR